MTVEILEKGVLGVCRSNSYICYDISGRSSGSDLSGSFLSG